MWYEDLFAQLESSGNPYKVAGMEAYMKNQFKFLGIQTPQLREITHPYFKKILPDEPLDWNFVQTAWNKDYREAQYAAVCYLAKQVAKIDESDLDRLKDLITTKSWWDTVDGLAGIVGQLSLRLPNLSMILLEWSQDPNLWVRRTAIIHQNGRKNAMDEDLLSQIILNNLGTKEFFINKAIGWALRDYAWHKPEWVAQFVEDNRCKLASLSIREASKHLS